MAHRSKTGAAKRSAVSVVVSNSAESPVRRALALLRRMLDVVGRYVPLPGERRRRRNGGAQAWLVAVVESSDDAIISKTLDGTITSWNHSAERIFGYTATEAVGRTITLIIPPDRLPEETTILERLARGERIEHLETVRVAKDGREVHVSLTSSPVRDGRGRIVGASKVVRDISERKHTGNRLRALADNMSQLAWMADEKGRVFWYNQRWFDYTGTTLEEVQGWGWTKLHHPDHVDRVVSRIQHSWDTGAIWEDTFPLRGKDGKYRWFLSRAIPIRDERGRVLRWFGTNTDVTEQREAAEALRAADRRKDEFLATMAHELRNPLAPIRSALEIMGRARDEPEVVEQARATMERQMTNLERLVDDLLDISRITRDKLELHRETLELTSSIAQAIETCRPLAEASGHTIHVELPAEPIYVQGDAVRLAQVFANLLSNACKYTQSGGRLALSAGLVGDNVAVSIVDSGAGIPAELLPRIFDMFVQIGSSDSSRGGLGIGLTLARRLVEMHGGAVTARSDGPGRGSEFIVTLPLYRGPVDIPSKQPTLPGDGRTCRVLVVDDNVDAAESLGALLSLSGHETRTAHDGVRAIELAAVFRPDVILLDIGMPALNGHDTARLIRQRAWGKAVILVALTGWGQEEDRRKSEAAGIDHHLVKPVNVDALLALLARVAAATS